MLRSLDALTGASVVATDGKIGRAHNFFFDDESWTIRYLVVVVGNWFVRRYAIISTAAVSHADWAKKALTVHLTKEQVRNSPNIDAVRPVSRQQELAMNEYLGWSGYWSSNEFPFSPVPRGREYPVRENGDPHLRSAWDVTGYEVWAADAAIGRLEDFSVEEATWHLDYLIVKTGDWLQSRSLMVPTGWVESISWATHRVNLRAHAKGSSRKESFAATQSVFSG